MHSTPARSDAAPIASLLFLTLGAASPADAASFDCRTPANSTEKAICADPQLDRLDREHNRIAKELILRMQQAGNYTQALQYVQDSEEKWQKERNTCRTDTFCITTAYASRLAVLNTCFYPDRPAKTAPAPDDSGQSSNPQKCEPITPRPKEPSKKDNGEKEHKDNLKTYKEDLKNYAQEVKRYNQAHLQISDQGIKQMNVFEGMSLCLYNDSNNYATIGIGHLVKYKSFSELRKSTPPTDWLKYKNGISIEQAHQYKIDDIKMKVLDNIYGKITVKLGQCQIDSLLSFLFNAGPGKPPHFWKLINDCEWSKVGQKMEEYIRGGAGLPKRRKAEADTWDSCKYEQGEPQMVKCCKYNAKDSNESFTAKCGQGENIGNILNESKRKGMKS
ncbi:glycoside hydrolase family protein [Acidithiobacillus sulfuriphilus]|uniref:glycoside hydrolase family protein n=1 Tax=Acidithiobacillus sulfuriphilus TaxID=1867749 RepID=UPI003F6437CF